MDYCPLGTAASAEPLAASAAGFGLAERLEALDKAVRRGIVVWGGPMKRQSKRRLVSSLETSLAVVRSTGWALHHTSRLCTGLLAMGSARWWWLSCLLAGATWRLAQGPIEPWLAVRTHRAQRWSDDTAPVHVSFDGMFLAWEGFHKGVDYPLDRASFQYRGHRCDRAAPVIAAPAAHLTFSLAGLLLGRVVPRAVEVDHAQVPPQGTPSGEINLGWDLGGSEPSGSKPIDLGRFANSFHGLQATITDEPGSVRSSYSAYIFVTRSSTLPDEPGLVMRTTGWVWILSARGVDDLRGSFTRRS